MRKLQVTFFAMTFMLLSACSALGIPQADTFNKRVIVANGIVESIANTVPVLYESGQISAEDAKNTLARLRDASTGIDTAVLIKATSPAEADTRLVTVIAALNILKAELEQKK